MSEWSPEEVQAIGAIEEVGVAPLAGDGTPLASVTIWAVTVGGEVFVRSVHGTGAGWYRHVTETGRAVFSAGEISREVTFEPVNEVKNQAVTDAYNAKYAAQPDAFRQPMVEGVSLGATLKVVPV
ncbi:DUF2255 family protein [Gryllotalpicola protaetiae]|uniref:DUF2255 family protein n=1 Tax=Gryllotalpicola protaetiae TaxID=2419771 RepID=A0A387BR01_9MICO|nr:DUF2255 family protein [Gryllotalpicola protaetiae]AYG03470.1 DUF2255 family protein [Gryllotalpicola protaetiae]